MTSAYDSNLELSVLSCVIKNGNSFYEIRDTIERASFDWNHNQKMWDAMIEISDNDLYIDKVTLVNQMDKMGILNDYVTEKDGKKGRVAIDFLLSMNSDSDKIESYAVQLSESKNIRDILRLSDRATELALSGKSSAEILSLMDFESGKISGNSGAIISSLKTLGDAADESEKCLLEAMGGKSLYIETGLDSIDSFVGGAYPGRLYIVAASSNDGKSALLTDIAYNISVSPDYLLIKNKNRKRHKTGFITMEMSAREVVNRLIQITTGIDPIRLEQGKILERERDLLLLSLENFRKERTSIIFEDTPDLNIAQLRQKIRKMVADGCDFIVVDQLQQIQPMQAMVNLGRHVIYDFITYRLKAFAREFNVPIFLAHQLNRSSEQSQNKNSELSLANLNEGGERAADAIVFIRHDKKNQEIESSWFHWVKNRQGKKGRVKVNFKGQNILFTDCPDISPDGFSGEVPDDVMTDYENDFVNKEYDDGVFNTTVKQEKAI